MKNVCCVTWNDLHKELRNLKDQEIDKLLKKGIPRSVFSSVLYVLDNMGNSCPVCTSRIAQKNVQKDQDDFQPVQSKAEVIKSKIKCPACKGKGNRGTDENGIPFNCGRCLGSGVLDSSNTPKPVDPEVGNKINSLTEQVVKENKPVIKGDE